MLHMQNKYLSQIVGVTLPAWLPTLEADGSFSQLKDTATPWSMSRSRWLKALGSRERLPKHLVKNRTVFNKVITFYSRFFQVPATTKLNIFKHCRGMVIAFEGCLF